MLRLALASLLLGVTPTVAAPVQLPGEVTYRERIALPETAVLSIELVDLALPDRPRVRVSSPTGPGQVPLAFTLTFEDSLILPQHEYALNAEIEAGDLTFRNPEPVRVAPLAQSEPVTIVTSLVAQAVEPSSSEPPSEPQQLPLLGITWQATRIGTTPVPPGVDMTLLIESDLRAGGVGGCNSFFSQAAVTEDSFAIGEVSRTQRSCLYERNMLEQSFFEALKASVTWVVDNDTLTLLDSAAKPTLTFRN
ncbi:MAG TPA: META domain-containing protein [Devosia sp.]|nr:META domain-containing protein [Devosia sp.]